MNVSDVLVSSAIGSLAGVLTRPCCVLPIALATLGVGGAAASEFVGAHRQAFLIGSGVMLVIAAFVTFRREGGMVAKCFTVAASLVAFALSRAWIGV